MKLVIVGGGSSYTPELVDGLIHHYETLPVSEICLMDINAERLEILCGMSQRMIQRAGLPLKVSATTDLERALDGASFVNSLVRVGGMAARILDETVPLRFGVVGQETTGPGGMMKALRTIPVMLGIAHQMEITCPDAWLINYTNPSGIIAEALGRYSGVRWISLCSGPDGWIAQILNFMGVSPERANIEWVGLNHLGFATRVWVDGKDVTGQAVEAASRGWNIDPEWMQALGVIPATYLRYYFHHQEVVAEYQKEGHQSRGEVVQEIEQELLRQYADPLLTEKPELLRKRGGGGYSDAAISAMKAIYHNTGQRQIMQVLNQGAVDGIPGDASVEVACMVDQIGAHPIRIGPLPLAIRGLVQAVKAYESLTVDAAVEKSYKKTLQAMMTHPLVNGWETAKPLVDALFEANRPWLSWV
jgi:6-phospho-beta-glucosidase